MKSMGWRALAAAATLMMACAEAPQSQNEATTSTSRDLLASPRPQPKQIDIATLGYDRGSRQAPVRVIEMSDFGCGYCRKFHQETWPVLREEFVESGKVEWKFMPFISGMFRNSPEATAAAECMLEQSGPLFETMGSRVWDGQPEWKEAADPDPWLRNAARESGADMQRFDACLKDGTRSERIAAATALANQVGVRGTPTFFVVGYPPIQGALPTETFRQVLNMVHEDALQKNGR